MKKIILFGLILFCFSYAKAAGSEMLGFLENDLSVNTAIISSTTVTQIEQMY